MTRNLLLLSLALLASTCAKSAPPSRASSPPTNQATDHAIDRPVHAIDLPHYLPYLPAGADRELFASRCLSCHSTRYITMQPPLTAAKWEENVKKMIKTYAAPIREDEAPRLAVYLVAMQQSDPDPLARTAEFPAQLPALANGDIARGKQLYATACASCHGAEGKGDGKNMATLLPRATDLTDGCFAPAAIEAAVVRGVGGTAMPAFPSISEGGLAALVAYTSQLGHSDKPRVFTSGTLIPVQQLYDSACASCHGKEGNGDGFNAPTLGRKPTSFRLRQPSEARATAVLNEGVPGTSMPSWKAKFDDAQRAALTNYVRTMFAAKEN